MAKKKVSANQSFTPSTDIESVNAPNISSGTTPVANVAISNWLHPGQNLPTLEPNQLGNHGPNVFGKPLEIFGNLYSNMDQLFRSNQQASLTEEIAELTRQLKKQTAEAREKEAQNITLGNDLQLMQQTLSKITEKEQIQFLLARISPRAHADVMANGRLQESFQSQNDPCKAFVMSIDIRRSTALMLKARTPELFATFINGLCDDFLKIVTENNGVFDKFTGDGVLAFYPEFFSGKDVGYWAIKSAIECHSAFNKRFKSSRTAFTSVMLDVGLGIGIDYGDVHLMRMADGLTVVGGPVVYACRLGGAPIGEVLLNQPAFENVQEHSSRAFIMSETSLEIKHEGQMLAYSVRTSGIDHTPAPPTWEKNSLIT